MADRRWAPREADPAVRTELEAVEPVEVPAAQRVEAVELEPHPAGRS